MSAAKRCVNLLKEQNILILHGETGAGKTSTAYEVARMLGCSVVELCGWDKSVLEQLKSLIRMKRDLSGNKILILLDEADGVSDKKKLKELLKNVETKVILTVDDVQKFSSFRGLASFIYITSNPLVLGDKVVRDYRHARLAKEFNSETFNFLTNNKERLMHALQTGDYSDISRNDFPFLLDLVEKGECLTDAYLFAKFLALTDYASRVGVLSGMKFPVKRV